MWSEKRGIESYMIFSILPIMINIATNAIYFMSDGSYETIRAVDSFNKFTIFCVLICCLFNFLERGRKISKDEKKELNKQMFVMKLLNIFFIGYIVFTIIIVKNINIIISALIIYV